MVQMWFQNKCLRFSALLAFTALWCSSCNEAGYSSPEDYDFSRPQRSQLGKTLNEISGICLGDSGSLLAISDSKEKIFRINLKTKKLSDYRTAVVPSNSDVEDLVQLGAATYLLRSNGELIEVPKDSTDSTGSKIYLSVMEGRNDFETLYYDPTAEGLVMICKSCAHEKGQGIRTAYRFDLKTKTFDSSFFFTIDKEEIKRLVKNTNAKFDPSAAAIHPVNKRLYILSSAGNLMVVTDTRGKVMEAYNLNPDEFPQAEGIAFATNGDMYISNEGKIGKPNLLFFPYYGNGKKKEK